MIIPYGFLKQPSNKPFIFNVTVTSGETIRLPFESSGTYNLTVNYGDGGGDKVVTSYNDPNASNTYTNAGTYLLSISGVCTLFEVNNSAEIATNIVETVNWGSIGLTDLNFNGCSNMIVTATDIPDFSNISTFGLNSLFQSCSSITTIPNINSWDMSNITSLTALFRSAINFNQDISGWDVSNVTVFSSMFQDADSFNTSIDNWTLNTVSNIILISMFEGANSFNQPLNSWNTNKVTSLESTFQDTPVFNQPLNDWDVSNVTNMQETFRNADSFDQPLNNWNVGNVENFAATFQLTPVFNQDISGWNVSKGTLFNSMFQSAGAFNQPIGAWTLNAISNVSMVAMFRACDTFDQSLAGWNMEKVNNLDSFLLDSAGLSTSNYDATLISWDAQTLVANLTPNMGGSTFTSGGAGETARTSIEIGDGWVFTDGGGV